MPRQPRTRARELDAICTQFHAAHLRVNWRSRSSQRIAVTQRGERGRELPREWLEMLPVVAVAIDRAVIDLLGDLRVARRRAVAASFVKVETRRLERQLEEGEQTTSLSLRFAHEVLIPKEECARIQLAAIVLRQTEHGAGLMHDRFDAIA